jgi:hypothetical protein
VIGILFKAFFLFIAGIIALALFGVLIGLLFGGMAAFPLKNYLLSGYSQELLAWASLVLFLGVPIVALITWLIRRIMGARSRNHYLGYVFASLWLIGLICSVALFASLIRNFRAKDYVEDEVTISQPAKGKLYVDLMNGRKAGHYYSHDWRGFNWDGDWPLFGDNYDSLYLNTVRVNVVRSKDSSFHIQRLRFSHAPLTGSGQGAGQEDTLQYQPAGQPAAAGPWIFHQPLRQVPQPAGPDRDRSARWQEDRTGQEPRRLQLVYHQRPPQWHDDPGL